MTNNIQEFYDNLNYGVKNITEYQDDKGNVKLIPTVNLLLQCEYVEFETEKLDTVYFQKIINRKDLPTTKGMRMVDKYTVTNNKKDQGTIVEVEKDLYYCWIVSNQLKISDTFVDKELAVEYVKKINEIVKKEIEV